MRQCTFPGLVPPMVVVVDRRRRGRGQKSLAAAELAALHLEAHGVRLLSAAAAAGACLTARRRDHNRSRGNHRSRGNRGGRDGLNGRLDDLLLNNRLRLRDLHGLSGGGLRRLNICEFRWENIGEYLRKISLANPNLHLDYGFTVFQSFLKNFMFEGEIVKPPQTRLDRLLIIQMLFFTNISTKHIP